MRFLEKANDGGVDSGVTGYFLIEIKPLFSIVLLKFNKGTREAYHSHAFNAITFWLYGKVVEHHRTGQEDFYCAGMFKYTPRHIFHKIEALRTSWAISFRGPWRKIWYEYKQNELIVLTNHRIQVA